MMQRWNYAKHDYEPYEVPTDWHCPLVSMDMNLLINCASCGKQLTYGKAYCSHEIHTEHGMGYSVCDECEAAEIRREREARAENDAQIL